MSTQNVRTATRVIEAFNVGDLDGFAEHTTPDFEWHPALAALAGVSYRGRAGVAEYLDVIRANFEGTQTVFEESRDLGDRVLSVRRFTGKGFGNHEPSDLRTWSVVDFRAAEIRRIRGYFDRGRALQAAGLAVPLSG